MKKTKKLVLILLVISVAITSLYAGINVIYIKEQNDRALNYLVNKYDKEKECYKIIRYYPRYIVNNTSSTSNLFEFYFTNEKWLIETNNRAFFVEKIQGNYYDNYQLEDISKWCKSYLQNNVDENIVGMEVSTKLIYDSELPNLPTNTNKLISYDMIESFLFNEKSPYKKTLTIYYRVDDSNKFRNAVGNGNNDYNQLKESIKNKLPINNCNIDINICLFENDIEFKRFKQKSKKGYNYEIYGITYEDIEKENGYF